MKFPELKNDGGVGSSYQDGITNGASLDLVDSGSSATSDENENPNAETKRLQSGVFQKRTPSMSVPSPIDGEPGLMKPIAICGMACRLPGGIHSPRQLWDFLLAKGDARAEVPASRYRVSSHYSSTAKPGAVKTEYGYFLDENVKLDSLDTSFFSISKAELERVDPQQRQFLEVARECIDDAGEVNWRGSKTGVYAGNFGEDWCEIFAKDSLQVCLYIDAPVLGLPLTCPVRPLSSYRNQRSGTFESRFI